MPDGKLVASGDIRLRTERFGAPQARLRTVPGMGHGFLSPGLPRLIGELILEHTGAR